jgi:cytochrome oxidase Cu insertion factor (SCO1/SenC/PrrC family)
MLLPVAMAAMLIVGPVPVAADGPKGSVAVTLDAPAPGDAAPPFALKGSDGRTYRLADYRGKQAVVLAWFAKAFTGG